MKYECADCGDELTKEEYKIWVTQFPNGFRCSCRDAKEIVKLRKKVKELKKELEEKE